VTIEKDHRIINVLLIGDFATLATALYIPEIRHALDIMFFDCGFRGNPIG